MKILWFSWRDMSHPLSGGAELVNEKIIEQLSQGGHEVILIVGAFKNCKKSEVKNGYKIIRLGNKYTVYFHAFKYYIFNLIGWADLVIDEMNTFPFFCKFFVKEKNIMFIHQLCREVWFHEMRLPFSIVGYLLEPLYLRLLSDRKVITISNSTKKDLARYGFKENNISIITELINLNPIINVGLFHKFTVPTLLSFGATRSMKRPIDQIKAYEIAKAKIPSLRLIIAGNFNTKYGQKVMKYINSSIHSNDIILLGYLNEFEKSEVMRQCHLLLVTSVKEGWGLTVSEANSQGTPAVVYNSDGLRDSVIDGFTGFISKENSPSALSDQIIFALTSESSYLYLQKNSLEYSSKLNIKNSYSDFIAAINQFLIDL